jgi:hypothetical protein
MDFDEQTSRRRFLRQLGIGLAVGIGAAALPSRASAGAGQCCASVAQCGSCNPGQKNYWCDCIDHFYCTGCIPQHSEACFSAQC